MSLSILQSLARQTTGGLQLWTDHVYRDGYRIQQHALSKHWRLLDDRNRRLAAGPRSDVERQLDELASAEDWNQRDEPFVILLHGLLRSSYCMRRLQNWLLQAGFPQVARFAYASTRASVLDHAAALTEYVESLPANSRLSFVGHSMGNIVVRAAIGKWKQNGDPSGVLPRMHRVVMLAPPNNGAAVARRLSQTALFGIVAGPGALELGPHWDSIEAKLSSPPCPFAILAGDRSSGLLQNPLVDGANDYLVSVDEARLPDAASFATRPLPHATMMSDRAALEFVTEFLKS